MAYLVTGGTGLIGAYITQPLTREREQVIVYDIDPRPDLLESLIGKGESAPVKIVKGDIRDLAHLIRTAKEYNTTKIVHMAALLSVGSQANPSLAVRINCDGMANVLETARILGLEKVVYASSCTVFGPPEKYEQEYIPNDAPHYPTSVYGACKSFCERLAENYFNDYGVDSIGLRFPQVYGVGHVGGAAARITEELIVKPALGEPGIVPYGDSLVNWLYVEDAARAVVMVSKGATTKARAFTVYGDTRSIAEAADCVRKLIRDADIKLLAGYIPFPAKYDTTQINQEIGYRPQWSLEDGIKQIIDAVRKLNRQ